MPFSLMKHFLQNDSLKEEAETLKEEIGVLRSEIKALGTDRPTWAAVAAQGNGGLPVRPPTAGQIPIAESQNQTRSASFEQGGR